jgi:hypothetical protein
MMVVMAVIVAVAAAMVVIIVAAVVMVGGLPGVLAGWVICLRHVRFPSAASRLGSVAHHNQRRQRWRRSRDSITAPLGARHGSSGSGRANQRFGQIVSRGTGLRSPFHYRGLDIGICCAGAKCRCERLVTRDTRRLAYCFLFV